MVDEVIVPEVVEEGVPVTSLRPGEVTAEMVKDIRLQLGLTQLELAGRLGCHKGMVSGWENGRFAPSKCEYLEKLTLLSARALKEKLGVDLEALKSEGRVLRERVKGRNDDLKFAARDKMLGKLHLFLDSLTEGKVVKMNAAQLVGSIEKMARGIKDLEGGGESPDAWAELIFRFGVKRKE